MCIRDRENLCQLPLYHNALLRTEKFLNQMGDFSYSLMKRINDGGEITAEERETLESLNTEVEKLSIALHELENSEETPFSWDASSKAVSYTHLDVYKRQILLCPARPWLFQSLFRCVRMLHYFHY